MQPSQSSKAICAGTQNRTRNWVSKSKVALQDEARPQAIYKMLSTSGLFNKIKMRFPTNQNFLTFIERNFSDFMRKKINFSWVPKVLRAEGTPITSIKYPQLLSQGLSTEQCNACGSHSVLLETRQVGRTSNLHYFMLHSQTLLSLRLPIIQNSTSGLANLKIAWVTVPSSGAYERTQT